MRRSDGSLSPPTSWRGIRRSSGTTQRLPEGGDEHGRSRPQPPVAARRPRQPWRSSAPPLSSWSRRLRGTDGLTRSTRWRFALRIRSPASTASASRCMSSTRTPTSSVQSMPSGASLARDAGPGRRSRVGPSAVRQHVDMRPLARSAWKPLVSRSSLVCRCADRETTRSRSRSPACGRHRKPPETHGNSAVGAT